MKVASKRPRTVEVPVYVTKDQYEIWYAKPVSLGKITKTGTTWTTGDGHRFLNSRDAMRYLVNMSDRGIKIKPAAAPAPIRKLQAAPAVAATPVKEPVRRQGASAVSGGIVTNTKVVQDDGAINQNHPLFEKFLDFIEYTNQRNATSRARARTAEVR